MRFEWDLKDWTLNADSFPAAFHPIATEYHMLWRIAYSEIVPNVAIFVSRFDHCLSDLLYRNRMGELNCKISMIISNHSDTKELAGFYNIPFHEITMDPERKDEIEQEQLKLLKKNQIDLIVLARYMQILSPRFVNAYPNQIINIHHSFLPAFLGAKPYHQAFARGVKLIGATSHYVTEVLDDGPIIDQDVMRISHRDQVGDLIQKGRDLEKQVLSRAVKWHLENRVIIFGKKTVVFD
jgi:formyltetrahydrofolate deformylase